MTHFIEHSHYKFCILTFQLSTLKLSTFKLSTFNFSNFQLFKLSTFKLSTFKLSNFPTFNFQTFNFQPNHPLQVNYPGSTSKAILTCLNSSVFLSVIMSFKIFFFIADGEISFSNLIKICFKK